MSTGYPLKDTFTDSNLDGFIEKVDELTFKNQKGEVVPYVRTVNLLMFDNNFLRNYSTFYSLVIIAR